MATLTFNQALEAEAIKRMDAAIAGEKDTMGSGNLPDHPAYKYHSGIIKGLEDAKEILRQTLSDIQRV